MKNTATAIIFALATAILFASRSEACTGSPSMAVEDACQKATTGINETYWQCRYILQAAPREAEVTVYAAAAGKRVSLEYEALRAITRDLLKNQSLSGELKDAYNGCLSDRDAATDALGAALQKVYACDLKMCSGDFDAALSSLEKCRVRLEGLQNIGPTVALLYGCVLDKKDVTTLAQALTRLAAS
jgi:hypothetical protein